MSLFLQNNIHHRQVSAYTGEALNAACFNTNSFRDYFKGICVKLARETEVDGFFWDEPHMVVDMYEELGVDRLATWTYRGGYGTSVAVKDPLELWEAIGANCRRVLKK